MSTARLRVAEAAFRNGARRFVFVSSIKAVAEADSGRPLREDDSPAPQDAYGRSKYDAEQALMRYGQETGLEVVIVRPPLVYGPEVRANFLRLMDAIWKGMPLPLGFGQREAQPGLRRQPGRRAGALRDRSARRAPMLSRRGRRRSDRRRTGALARQASAEAGAAVAGAGELAACGRPADARSAQVERLIGSLQVDTTRIRAVLGWQPPHSLDDGLAATARWYRSTH